MIATGLVFRFQFFAPSVAFLVRRTTARVAGPTRYSPAGRGAVSVATWVAAKLLHIDYDDIDGLDETGKAVVRWQFVKLNWLG